MNSDQDTLRAEYPEDLIKSGVRGKYAKKNREGTNELEPLRRRLSSFSKMDIPCWER